VRRSLTQQALLTLVRTLGITELDQCSSVLVGTSRYLQGRLQSVLNTATRLVYSRRMSERTTSYSESYTGYVSQGAFNSRCVFWRTTAPAYLAESLRPTSEVVAGCCLRSADTTTLLVPSTRVLDVHLSTTRVSCVCIAGVEQFATTDQGRLTSTDFPA